MMRELKTLRDFMSGERLRWLPGNLRLEQVILLCENKICEDAMNRTVIQVFDSKGVWIGEITNPHSIPE